jgi:hypothetical protein
MREVLGATQSVSVLSIALTSLVVVVLIVGTQMAYGFTPVKPGNLNGLPIKPGQVQTGGQSATLYFMGHTGISTLDLGNPMYDAVAWVKVCCPADPVPAIGWAGPYMGGAMVQCAPGGGDLGYIAYYNPLLSGTYTITTWGTYCVAGNNPAYNTIFHLAGQPNGPVFDPDPPAVAPCPSCDPGQLGGDPVSLSTGLYRQDDTDIEVPDVMPIRLTRTYRTVDTATRKFGIGATHPYDNYMLRDDLCRAMIESCVWQDRKGRRILDGQSRSSTFDKE